MNYQDFKNDVEKIVANMQAIAEHKVTYSEHQLPDYGVEACQAAAAIIGCEAGLVLALMNKKHRTSITNHYFNKATA